MTAQEPGPRSGRPRRRTFSAAYKLRVLTAYDEVTAPGERGVLLRREGLYHSHIKDWRQAREAGTLLLAVTWHYLRRRTRVGRS